MTEVWGSKAVTDRSQLCILLALADWADDEGRCWPSLIQIARKSRMDRATAHRHLADMRGHWVEWDENDGGRSKRNQYRIIRGNLGTPMPEPVPATPDVPPVLAAVEAPKQSHDATVFEPGIQSHGATVSTPETVAKSGAKQSHGATGNKPSLEPPFLTTANPHRGGGSEERASAPSATATEETPSVSWDWLTEGDLVYLPTITEKHAAYQRSEARELLIHTWRRRANIPDAALAEMVLAHPWPVFVAAVIIAADDERPHLRFLASILKRLNQQFHEQQTRNNQLDAAELAGGDGAGVPGTLQALAPRTGGTVPPRVRQGAGRGDALPTRDQVARKREGELSFREYLLRCGYDRALVASLTDEQVTRFLTTGSFGEPGGDGGGAGAAGVPVRALPR